MRKILTVLVVCLIPYCLQAQPIQSKSAKTEPNATDPADIWMVVYKVDAATGFPAEAFSLDNADHFISQVNTWITSNQTTFQQMLSDNSGSNVLVVKRSDYRYLENNKAAELKGWLKEMSRYFNSQETHQVDQQNRYLLSVADFNKLQDFLKK